MANIAGATSSTFLITQEHFGKYFRVGVSGTNVDGTGAVAYSSVSTGIVRFADTKFAGTGVSGYQDGPGSTAQFGMIYGRTTDGTALYVTDDTNKRIRKIDPSGAVSTIAGTGTASRTDGPAGDATFSELTNWSDLVSEGFAVLVDDFKNPDSTNNPNWTLTPWVKIDDPMSDAGFASNVTKDYADLQNDNFWTKTHFGALVGKTIGTNYERGDNIYYQGKHYVYVSHLNSNDPAFTASSGDEGVTSFEQLLMQGAVVELSMHVDTVGAGGAQDLDHGVYYKPNQDLEFIDRLPDSGIVRTNSIERRTDPSMSADGIFNSRDDLFYGGLNPGNDGIYGTMDDYYTTTAFSEVAKQGGHVDSDADNNKDLLDTSYGLDDFSVADFVDYIQTIANFRAVNGGTMSRLDYASQMLDESRVNLEAAYGRIMDADIATESTRMAQQNVLMQAGAAMVSQANQMNNIVLQLLQ